MLRSCPPPRRTGGERIRAPWMCCRMCPDHRGLRIPARLRESNSTSLPPLRRLRPEAQKLEERARDEDGPPERPILQLFPLPTHPRAAQRTQRREKCGCQATAPLLRIALAAHFPASGNIQVVL